MTKLDFPDTPSTGQQFGSAGTVWRWDGTRWGSTAGAAGARGAVAYAQIVANIGGYTNTLLDVYGCNVTFNTIAGRMYKVTGELFSYSSVAGDWCGLVITNESGSALQSTSTYLAAATTGVKSHVEIVFTASATGSQVLKLMYQRSSGSGTHTIYAGPTFPSFILVEDITYEAGSSGPGSSGSSAQRVAVGINENNISIISAGAVALSAIATIPCVSGDVFKVDVNAFATMIAGTTATVMHLGIEASGGGINHAAQTSAQADQGLLGGGGGQTQQIPMYASKVFTVTSGGTFSAGSRGWTTSPGTSGHAMASNRCQITRISP